MPSAGQGGLWALTSDPPPAQAERKNEAPDCYAVSRLHGPPPFGSSPFVPCALPHPAMPYLSAPASGSKIRLLAYIPKMMPWVKSLYQTFRNEFGQRGSGVRIGPGVGAIHESLLLAPFRSARRDTACRAPTAASYLPHLGPLPHAVSELQSRYTRSKSEK